MALPKCPQLKGIRCPHYEANCDDKPSKDCHYVQAHEAISRYLKAIEALSKEADSLRRGEGNLR